MYYPGCHHGYAELPCPSSSMIGPLNPQRMGVFLSLQKSCSSLRKHQCRCFRASEFCVFSAWDQNPNPAFPQLSICVPGTPTSGSLPLCPASNLAILPSGSMSVAIRRDCLFLTPGPYPCISELPVHLLFPA